MKKIIFLLILFSLFSMLFAEEDKITNPADSLKLYHHEMINAVLWQKTSAEYRALAYQAFNLATLRLQQALQKSFPKPLAVVLDLDETVLDNTTFEAMTILHNMNYSKHFNHWVDKTAAEAVPGATEFLRFAQNNNVEIYYISNRDEDKYYQKTLENLQKLNFPNADPKHILLRETTSSKQERREIVEKDHHIILFLGDNLIDFTEDFRLATLAERRFAVDSLRAEFGRKFIVLPNPIYGEWEKALYDGKRNLPPHNKRKKQVEHLSN